MRVAAAYRDGRYCDAEERKRAPTGREDDRKRSGLSSHGGGRFHVDSPETGSVIECNA